MALRLARADATPSGLEILIDGFDPRVPSEPRAEISEHLRCYYRERIQ